MNMAFILIQSYTTFIDIKKKRYGKYSNQQSYQISS